MKTFYKFILIFFIYLGTAFSQFFGYQSVGYGYHRNPLYNYQKIGDQLKQTYTELSYKYNFPESQFSINYMSGLMIFNKLEARNYYEHKILNTYKIIYPKLKKTPTTNNLSVLEEITESETIHDENADNLQENLGENYEQNFENVISQDSTDSYLDIGLLGSARHDKKFYKEYDNFGIDAFAFFRFIISENYYLRISNVTGYRNYYNIKELSNVVEKLSIQIGNNQSEFFGYGINLSAGYKFYTLTVYDTSKYEPFRTFIEKKPGTGKPGAKLKIYSEKKILTKPQANGTWQISPEIFTNTKIGNPTIEMKLLYYYNPKITVRYLAQYANTSILTEDIYNDNFSYEGIKTHLRLKFLLPLNIQVLLDFEFQKKKFGGPALNLIGEVIATNRKDIRSSIDIYASRYFKIFNNLGLDIYLSGTILRNQSNDHYNDFSLYSLVGGVGFGF